MNAFVPTTVALPALAGLLIGIAIGAVYFFLLYHAVRLQAAAGPPARIVPLYVLRLGIAVAGFWGLAHFGAVPLLAGLAGFLLARFLAQRFVREA
jgi:F1F0 ATPase subunit 2